MCMGGIPSVIDADLLNRMKDHEIDQRRAADDFPTQVIDDSPAKVRAKRAKRKFAGPSGPGGFRK